MTKAHFLALPLLLLLISVSPASAQGADGSADAKFFLEADITGVELVEIDKRDVLRVIGTIDASSFKRAWMKIGAGDKPETWKYVGQKRKYPIHDDTLGKIPLTEFYGSELWQVVINVEHVDGTIKSDTFQVKVK
jgi:hypothetical protein